VLTIGRLDSMVLAGHYEPPDLTRPPPPPPLPKKPPGGCWGCAAPWSPELLWSPELFWAGWAAGLSDESAAAALRPGNVPAARRAKTSVPAAANIALNVVHDRSRRRPRSRASTGEV
jgi:hypothetical protein